MKTQSRRGPLKAADTSASTSPVSKGRPELQDDKEDEIRTQVRNRIRIVEQLKKQFPKLPY